MPHVYAVMVATKNNDPNVRHTFYSQGAHKWMEMFDGKAIERKKGVCNGLCLRWIKSTHQTSLINILSKTSTDKKAEAIRASVMRIQDKSVALNKQPVLPSRKSGGFGSVTVIQFSDSTYFVSDHRYPNQQGITCPNQADLRRRVALSVAESRAAYKYASIINVEPASPNAIGHCVAVVASPRRVRFFDPNGGVLEFQDRPSFRRWFENDFGTISYYGDSGTMLQVINYHYDYAEEEPV
ncbi:YopT-type cysteine protease domain-containing protein [Paraburkholderia atlantica]|uniref:YopT-type cysteine protease domain-containing protein n=2 Tax=Paraburkholderia TaxID=1822464 RepID=UPI00187BA66D|nr:YopT-type cysteine protease domain-containing protein [Paraburkholderia atlantica]